MNEVEYGEGGDTPKGCYAGASTHSVKKHETKIERIFTMIFAVIIGIFVTIVLCLSLLMITVFITAIYGIIPALIGYGLYLLCDYL